MRALSSVPRRVGRVFMLLLTCLTSTMMIGQEDKVEEMLLRPHPSCQDIFLNSTTLIPKYFSAGHLDTVSAILGHWERRCNENRHSFRMRTLMAIQADSFALVSTKGEATIRYMIRDRLAQRTIDGPTQMYFPLYGMPSDRIFNEFTHDLANDLTPTRSFTPTENLFLDLYSSRSDTLFFRLQGESDIDPVLVDAYRTMVNENVRRPEGHSALYSGIWSPTDSLAILGDHPVIGLLFGIKTGRVLLDLDVALKFLDTPRQYLVERGDSLFSTDQFIGGYIGLRAGLRLFEFGSQEVDLFLGVGNDGFEALRIEQSDSEEDITQGLNTLSVNAALGYRSYLKNRSYVGVEARYSVVNYLNRNGTDLSGDVWQFTLQYGISRNLVRDKRLYELDHKPLVHKRKKYAEWLAKKRTSRPLWYY